MRISNGRLLMLAPMLAAAVLVLGACGAVNAPAAASGKAAAQPSAAGSASKGGSKGFAETPIGEDVQMEGVNIAAVYFQPVQMEPADRAGLKPEAADIHLEADIHALKDNQTGFGAGEWIPALTVKYGLKNLATGQGQEGSLMPMNAKDGPHYGANVKMMGAGKYQLSLAIDSPEKQGYLLHVDEETGVPGRFWRKSLEASWEFNYLPRKF